MLMLPDATKIDLIFPDVPLEDSPPWVASRETLQRMDDHFWDWIVWLASKERGGKEDLVWSELQKLYEHILAPLGVAAPAWTIAAAIRAYLTARDCRASEMGVTIGTAAESAVLARLRVVYKV